MKKEIVKNTKLISFRNSTTEQAYINQEKELWALREGKFILVGKVVFCSAYKKLFNKLMRNILKEGNKQTINKFVCLECGEEWETDAWIKNNDGKLLSNCQNCGKSISI